jgi:hypothetical protein
MVSLTGIITGQHFDAFKYIQQFQLRQSIPGKVEIALVLSSNLSRDIEAEIKSEFQNRVGDSIELSIVYEKSIEPTLAGKHKFLIQELDLQNFRGKK